MEVFKNSFRSSLIISKMLHIDTLYFVSSPHCIIHFRRRLSEIFNTLFCPKNVERVIFERTIIITK